MTLIGQILKKDGKGYLYSSWNRDQVFVVVLTFIFLFLPSLLTPLLTFNNQLTATQWLIFPEINADL